MPQRKKKQGKRSASKGKSSETKCWTSLTWGDVDVWATGRSMARGRTYQRQGRVKDLAATEDGRLLATVVGGERYTASVWLTSSAEHESKLQSKCTCPVGYDGCKHAVAVVAEYLQALADEEEVPTAEPDDPRWAKLDRIGETDDDLDEWESDEWESDEYDEEEEEEDYYWQAEAMPKRRAKRRSKGRTRTEWDEAIRQHIGNKGHEELVELVCSLVDRFSELREEFQERITLGEGNVDRLVTQARRELRELTSESAWRNSWTGEGYTPDFTRLRHRLERLLELGHADAVVDLGCDFIQRAMRQVEESHDEGETAMAAADCMPVIFDAVNKSSVSGADKILFAIDACLVDPFDVVGDAIGTILDAKWAKSDWSAVADSLDKRLKKIPKTVDREFSSTYERDCISGWLLTALENAGRDDEMLAVYEDEARETSSYKRLVEYLIAERKYEEAERWAKEGIEKTCEKLPGIASSLATELTNLARRRRKWDVVAADAAWQFFEHPGTATFKELIDCAAKAKCVKAVRAAALAYLETGKAPIGQVVVAKGKEKGRRKLRVDSAWPQPVPDHLAPLMCNTRSARVAQTPHFDVLLDIAIDAKKPDDVLHWYDKMHGGKKRSAVSRGRRVWPSGSTADRVAAAVSKSHPEQALEIYRQGLESHLPHASMSSCESAAAYLKAMRPIMRSLKQAKEWESLVAEIREKYRNRPRFMEILDGVEGQTIVATQKARRRGRR